LLLADAISDLTLIVCAGVLSRLSSWLMNMYTVGHCDFFDVVNVNLFFSEQKWLNIFEQVF